MSVLLCGPLLSARLQSRLKWSSEWKWQNKPFPRVLSSAEQTCEEGPSFSLMSHCAACSMAKLTAEDTVRRSLLF